MEEKDAEAMKIKYGSAYTENNDIDNTLKYSIDAERTVDSRKFIEIVEARVEEIIEMYGIKFRQNTPISY